MKFFPNLGKELLHECARLGIEAPKGSSKSKIAGLLARALAMATSVSSLRKVLSGKSVQTLSGNLFHELLTDLFLLRFRHTEISSPN